MFKLLPAERDVPDACSFPDNLGAAFSGLACAHCLAKKLRT
jgi:hypothetical protein